MPHFNRFDIAEAYYLFACLYHSGGDTTDQIFLRLHRMRFEPGLHLADSDVPMMGLEPNGAEIFNELVARHPDAAGCREYLEIEWEG